MGIGFWGLMGCMWLSQVCAGIGNDMGFVDPKVQSLTGQLS